VKNLVAKLEVVGVRPDGERLPLRAEIGRPREERDGRWVCAIAIAPLENKVEDVRGTDSFHAVWLACALVLTLLGNLQAEGWRLENADGSEFPLEEYRKGLGSGPDGKAGLAPRR
jgi:uncharacterized protein DUF6968